MAHRLTPLSSSLSSHAGSVEYAFVLHHIILCSPLRSENLSLLCSIYSVVLFRLVARFSVVMTCRAISRINADGLCT
ncbi:uncharacterized protein LAESUDRAFT_181862 [Laetiporus sulphureus 93-53]|uniref:Uncharacterized protein n=1 Tax=Laetiporus sulphureus 93-53 TaxID=1314785 RepID=A0A165E9F3_9APHY|nr:uncharacterized protein LAESUDRAFT_181862 [Laetiporus sulphureus 93-53]KZT06525.1 hypothetical protein LAESUDRAFT_181862 [Laetiporus sulphureus 93-53]